MITVTKMAKFYTKFNIQIFGGARRDRTADLNTASVALSQLSYSPNKERRNNQTNCNVNIITLAQIFLVT